MSILYQVDGKVAAHRLILAAASPLLCEAMPQDSNEEVIISVPETSSSVMAALLDLIYKGRMNITPSNTWDIRSLVQVLCINAEDVSVISSGAKKPALPPIDSHSNVSNNSNDSLKKSSRKRKRESSGSVVPPLKTTKCKRKRHLTGLLLATTLHFLSVSPAPVEQPHKGRKRSKKNNSGPLDTSSAAETSGFHDLEDVETWVCAICQCYDPIITSPLKGPGSDILATTEWIGCDCNRWYHKYCTKLKHIDDSFSCKQLNRECLPMT